MNILKINLLICCLLFFEPLISQEPVRGIDSGMADYDGKQITLTGDVCVDHELGKIQAKNVIILSDPSEKKLRFTFLKMKDDVKITLKDGGVLTCTSSDLDYTKLTGIFLGNGEQENVIYQEEIIDKLGKTTPLKVTSHQMNLSIERTGLKENQSPKSFVNEIVAQDNVKITFNNNFNATANQATYHKKISDPSESQKSNKLSGTLILLPEVSTLCQVTNKDGDVIEAKEITIDIATKNLTFYSAKGTVVGSRKGQNTEEIGFSANTLIWDDPREILTLRDNVVLSQKGLGTIKNNNEVLIFQHTVNGKKQIRTIEGTGISNLAYNDDEMKLTHNLTCAGGFIIDHENLQASFDGLLNPQNNQKIEQVYFRDRMGEIYSDKLIINYSHKDNEIIPTKLTLLGNVQILDRFAVNPEDVGPLLRYSLADEVVYYPMTKEIVFSSNKNHRVLFFDKVNNMQISAPGLKIKRDQATNKESIQGFGDVRFSFAEQEFEQLKKRFQLIENVKKNESLHESK